MRFYPYISVLLYKHILTNWKPTFLKVCCLMYVLTWTEILSDGYRVLNWAFCQMFKILEFVFQVFVPQSVIILLFHGHDYCSMAKTAVNGPQTPCPSQRFSPMPNKSLGSCRLDVRGPLLPTQLSCEVLWSTEKGSQSNLRSPRHQ